MGNGISFTCKKCGVSNEAYVGVGANLPQKYFSIEDRVKKGECGEAYTKLAESTPMFAVNVENDVFVCDSCGYWSCETNMDLYAPNNVNDIMQMTFGTKTVKEWGYVPYVTKDELIEHYHKIVKVNHRCKKCGQPMKLYRGNLTDLPCKECGSVPRGKRELIKWD